MSESLGDGPMRFALKGEQSVEEQIQALTESEKACFDNLKMKWEEKHPDDGFSDSFYLRFARCSPGKEKFSEKAAWKVMKKFDKRYASLKAADLEKQLATKTLFPVPGLKTIDGHDMFYMRPARYFHRDTSVKDIIDNLAYCMNTMVEKEKACTEGIGFLAYMNDWTMKNFDVNYCYQFMMMLQGRVPVRVRLFLIVNPPSWFDMIWKIMKPMLAADFRTKVFVIKEDEMLAHLAPGAEEFLPDETAKGKVPTDALVQDYITYRKHVEAEST
jgi:CRAL/TRIO domain